MNHSFNNQTSDFGKTGLEFKTKNGFLIEPAALTSRLPENRMRQHSEFSAPKNWCPKNSAQNSQLADKHQTEKLREQRKTINHWFYVIKHNAALRGWMPHKSTFRRALSPPKLTANQKCHAAWIPLKRLVMFKTQRGKFCNTKSLTRLIFENQS